MIPLYMIIRCTEGGDLKRTDLRCLEETSHMVIPQPVDLTETYKSECQAY